MSLSPCKKEKQIGYFKSTIGKEFKIKKAFNSKPKDDQNEQVINNYNLGGNITIKNLNNISIENVMLQSSSIDSKLKYESVLNTEPAEKNRRGRKYKLEKDSKVLMKKNKAISKEKNTDNNKERHLSGEHEGVNKLIIDLRDEFNNITQKNLVRRGVTLKEIQINRNNNNNYKNNNEEEQQSICSMNSFIEDLNNDNIRTTDNRKYNIKTKMNLRNDLLLGNNNTGQFNISSKMKTFKSPTTGSKTKKNIPNLYYNYNQSNNSQWNNGTYGTNTVITSQHTRTYDGSNNNNVYSFNCINKQITFSIRTTRETQKEKTLLIQNQQDRIKELESTIALLQQYINSQQNVFVNHCKVAITNQIKQQEHSLLVKEREMNTHLIKENNVYKLLIKTILVQICKVIKNESIQINKENALISMIIKENEYLRQLNSSVSHILIKSNANQCNYNQRDNNNIISNHQRKNQRSSSSFKRMKNSTSLFISENDNKPGNLLSISSVVNKNLEETIKKLAECKSINEIEKISLSSSQSQS